MTDPAMSQAPTLIDKFGLNKYFAVVAVILVIKKI